MAATCQIALRIGHRSGLGLREDVGADSGGGCAWITNFKNIIKQGGVSPGIDMARIVSPIPVAFSLTGFDRKPAVREGCMSM